MKNYSLLLAMISVLCLQTYSMDNPAPKRRRILDSRSAFEKLPNEIKTHILSFLTTARGKTKQERLYAATANIRNFMTLNKAFAPFLDDEQITKYLITELANRYTNGNLIEAALALQTTGAGVFLKESYYSNVERIYASLNRAATLGQDDIIRFMLKYAPEGSRSPQGLVAAVVAAADNGHESTVKLLLEAGAQANLPATGSFTPLFAASKHGSASMVKMLIDAGANVNQQDNDLSTPLMQAAFSNRPIDVIQALLTAHANPNTQNKWGMTALHAALIAGNGATVDALIKAGANVNHADQENITPLMRAVNTGIISNIEKLLASGADINAKNRNGDTAYSIAQKSYTSNREAIMKLLEKHMAANPL